MSSMRDLTPSRWELLAPILDEALELSAEKRAAYLERACGGDSGLRAALEALLLADEASGDFLEESVEAYLETLSAPNQPGDPSLPSGTVLGPYRVARDLARGGMGAVYLAERADGQFEQLVALKVIRGGLDSAPYRQTA
jgi:serine/threonine protein kinase